MISLILAQASDMCENTNLGKAVVSSKLEKYLKPQLLEASYF